MPKHKFHRIVTPEIKSPVDDDRKIINMFDSIAHSYGLLNHLLSFGFDLSWRKRAVKLFRSLPTDGTVLDLCSGTGDFGFSLYRNTPFNGHIVQMDGAEKMLAEARRKAFNIKKRKFINFILSDALALPFKNNTFDGVMMSFGIRNLNDPAKGIKEMYRILKSGGEAVIIEFAQPAVPFFKKCYQYYSNRLIPLVGRLVSKSENAYSYLTHSIKKFNQVYNIDNELAIAGFAEIKIKKLTGGIVALFYASK